MKVTQCQVDWDRGRLNAPEIQVCVDSVPDDLVYEPTKVKHGVLWFAESEGYASFYLDNDINDGFGGAVIKIRTRHGDHKLVGPWSSRGGFVNTHLGKKVVPVALTTDPKVMDRGWTFRAAYLTAEKAREALALVPDAELVRRTTNYGEVVYEAKKRRYK